MKKLMTMAAALGLVLALAGCGSSAEKLPTYTGILEEKKDFMVTVSSEDDSEAYVFNLDGVECPAEEGDKVIVTYEGDIQDFDAQLNATQIELVEAD